MPLLGQEWEANIVMEEEKESLSAVESSWATVAVSQQAILAVIGSHGGPCGQEHSLLCLPQPMVLVSSILYTVYCIPYTV